MEKDKKFEMRANLKWRGNSELFLVLNLKFAPYIYCLIVSGIMPLSPDARDSSEDWDRLFSNVALGRRYDEKNKYRRAYGVPPMHTVILDKEITSVVSELHMPPGALIWYLRSIGWHGRLEFMRRIAVAYGNKVAHIGDKMF